MGWGLNDPSYPSRPVVTTLLVGMAVGVVILLTGFWTHPGLAGWSLVIGCASALLTGIIRTRAMTGR